MLATTIGGYIFRPTQFHAFKWQSEVVALVGQSLPRFYIPVVFYTPRKQSLGRGGYIGITLSVRPSVLPSMYLVSATPPKRLIGFL